MVVEMHKQKINKLITSTLLESTLTYLKSYLFLRMNSLPEGYVMCIFMGILFNTISCALFLGLSWSLLIYLHLILFFCSLNSIILSIVEGRDLRIPEGRIKILVVVFYFYISLLGLSYLPLYLYVSHKSLFLKPVALVIFMGFYNIYFLNNTGKEAMTLILMTINILIFLYLCIDNLVF